MSPDAPPTDDRLLHGLSHELPPPAALEDRLVGELRRRGLLAHRTSSSGLWRLAASALVAFALGLWLGPKVVATAPASEAGGRYLLLLYEPRPLDRAGVDLVAEYSAWAGDLARGGKLVAAEKLSVEERRFGVPEGAGDEIAPRREATGFFLIRASGLAEAERIAKECPHLRHGGEVSLRPVDPT